MCVCGGALRSFQITLQGVSVKGAASLTLTLSHCLPPYSYAVLFTFPRSLPWRPSYTWLRGGLSRAREHFTMVALLSFLYQAVESFSDLCSPYCVLRLVDSQWRDRFYCVAKLLMNVSIYPSSDLHWYESLYMCFLHAWRAEFVQQQFLELKRKNTFPKILKKISVLSEFMSKALSSPFSCSSNKGSSFYRSY